MLQILFAAALLAQSPSIITPTEAELLAVFDNKNKKQAETIAKLDKGLLKLTGLLVKSNGVAGGRPFETYTFFPTSKGKNGPHVLIQFNSEWKGLADFQKKLLPEGSRVTLYGVAGIKDVGEPASKHMTLSGAASTVEAVAQPKK